MSDQTLIGAIAAWKAAGGDVASLRLYCDALSGDEPRSACDPVRVRDHIWEIRNHPMLDEILYAGTGPEMVFPPTEAAVDGLTAEPTAESIAAALTVAVRRLDGRLYFTVADPTFSVDAFGSPMRNGVYVSSGTYQ
jgi:hypothetical protein